MHVDGWTRRRIEAVIVNVAHDSDNRQQPRVAIHVPKLYRVADRVLIWPPVARQRFADHGNVRSVRAVALVKDSSSNQRNFQRLEVSVRDDAEVRAAKITRPTLWLPWEPACPRPPSSRPLRRSPEVARAAVNAPRPAATAVESSNANTSTGILIDTLSSRGRFCGASAINPDTPHNAPSTPRPPPTNESRNASVRNWRISRPRAAPSALRMASSRSLAVA